MLFKEETTIGAVFNIMPDAYVKETFHLREIKVEENSAFALFDRNYESQMQHSPNHLTMTVLPLLTQRLFYAWACHKLQLAYDPAGKELIKIWPIRTELIYPALYNEDNLLKYEIKVEAFRKLNASKYYVKGTSYIADKITLNAEAVVFVV